MLRAGAGPIELRRSCGKDRRPPQPPARHEIESWKQNQPGRRAAVGEFVWWELASWGVRPGATPQHGPTRHESRGLPLKLLFVVFGALMIPMSPVLIGESGSPTSD